MKSSYLNLSEKEWKKKVETAKDKLKSCDLCGHNCQIDRLAGETGNCESGKDTKFSSAMPHFGEERPLVGSKGSGTIFLSNCNLSCVYCQNYQLSQLGQGEEVGSEFIAEKMLELQDKGCHNINWVSPTHFMPQLLESLRIASDKGLNVPIAYNTGGYDSVETLQLLDNVVDIYMLDMKYGSNENGLKYSQAPNYWDVNKKAVKEMQRQVGDLQISSERVAQRGLLIRHLVLPNSLSSSENVLEFIAEEISQDAYVNIMDQYRPCWKASEHEELNRSVKRKEYQQVVRKASELGLKERV